jgi:hypothetical protein
VRAEAARPALKITALPARLADRYRKLVSNLKDTLGRDTDRARAALRELCGEIRVAPHASGDYLVAELRLNEKPLMLAVSGSPVLMVAGARFRYSYYGSRELSKQPDAIQAAIILVAGARFGTYFRPATVRIGLRKSSAGAA